jgi:biopolymer transport protein ExbD
MARFRETGESDENDTDVDISPLIDCVFILLIFFIVSTTFVQESGMLANTPQAAPQQAQEDSETIILKLSEGGAVTYEGSDIGISGVRPLVKQQMRQNEAPVIIRAAPSTSTGHLVRVLDEARLAGAEKVSISSQQSGG